METQSPLQTLILSKSGQNLCKSRYLKLSGGNQFRLIFYFQKNILLLIVCDVNSQMVSPEKCSFHQDFGREKDRNSGKFIGSNLFIFWYKEFEKFALCKSTSQSEVIFIVYSESVESSHVKISFS